MDEAQRLEGEAWRECDEVAAFRAARDFLLAKREDYDVAYDGFAWPELREFNWARDWFDGVLDVEHADAPALWIVEEDGAETKATFAEMSACSSQLAGWLREHGSVCDATIMCSSCSATRFELWETVLACIKLGTVIIPASTLLSTADLSDRVDRGHVAHVVAHTIDAPRFEGVEGGWTRIAVGAPVEGWLRYDDSYSSSAAFRRRIRPSALAP